MPPDGLLHAAIRHQRAEGSVRVGFGIRDGRTRLTDLYQAGCLKARFPRTSDWAEAIVVNSSGGVACGDRLDVSVEVAAGSSGVLTAQAAERFYRATDGSVAARVRGAVTLAAGARLDWLPQESILFDAAALDRALDVDMAEDAAFLGIEAVLFGRAAMGETVRRGMLRDRITVRRAGRLIYHDAVRLDGDMAGALDRAAVGGGARAMATIVHVAPDAPGRLDALRAALAGMEAGASSWDGMIVARVLARDGAALRSATVAALSVLRDGRTLPRSWSL